MQKKTAEDVQRLTSAYESVVAQNAALVAAASEKDNQITQVNKIARHFLKRGGISIQ